MTASSTTAAYDAIIARITGFVPDMYVQPGQSVPVALSTIIGQRVWIVQAKDKPTFPYVTLRISGRQGDSTTHGLMQTFTLIVDCWNRPRNYTNITALSGIADQIECALIDWQMPGDVLSIRDERMRDDDFAYNTPADRDVCRQFMQFDGFMMPAYLGHELGVGR